MSGEVVVGLIGAVAGAVGALAAAFVLMKRMRLEGKKAGVDTATALMAVASEMVEDLQGELGRLQLRVGVLEGAAAELRRQLDGAQERIRNLEAENRQLREENVSLQQLLGEEREKRQALEKRLDQMIDGK